MKFGGIDFFFGLEETALLTSSPSDYLGLGFLLMGFPPSSDTEPPGFGSLLGVKGYVRPFSKTGAIDCSLVK
jgi:hypothetical protein